MHWRKTGLGMHQDILVSQCLDELLCIPGQVEFVEEKLHKVALLKSHPYADEMRLILQNLLNFFEIS